MTNKNGVFKMKILNNKGVGLVDVMASAFILSLILTVSIGALINLYAISKENTAKFNAGYIGNTVLNYLQDTDFTYYDTLMDTNGYYKLDISMCTDPTFDQATCEAALNPVINNMTFTSEELYFYIYPFSDDTINQQILADPNVDDIFKDFLTNDFELSTIGDKQHIIRIALVITLNERQTILLHGAIYNNDIAETG